MYIRVRNAGDMSFLTVIIGNETTIVQYDHIGKFWLCCVYSDKKLIEKHYDDVAKTVAKHLIGKYLNLRVT